MSVLANKEEEGTVLKKTLATTEQLANSGWRLSGILMLLTRPSNNGQHILNHFFTKANDINEEKLVPVLLSVMGTKTYGLLRNLITPAKPGDLTYQEIVTTLSEHYSPKPLIMAE